MNIKNIFQKSETSFNRKSFYRHSGYAATIAAVALALLLVINIVLSVVAERTTLQFDLSATGENSISAENAEFLKGIEKEVTLTVCADKASYTNGTLAEFAYQYFYILDEDGYYDQTIKLIDLYPTYNSNIKIEYIDLTSTAGSAIASEYPSIFYGDIIVKCGDNSKVVGYSDIYGYEDVSGYGAYYSITTNKLETALSSAINTVISGKTKTSAVLTAYSSTDVFNTLLGSQLKLNSFDVTEIKDNIISSIPAEVEQLYIICPTKDMLAEELKVLNNWLYNDGNLGRSLVFIPGSSVANIPNIIEFMKEWGVSYTDGVLYETNSSNHYPNYPTALFSFSNESNFKQIVPSNGFFITGTNVPMTTAFETNDSKTTNIIASTGDTTVAAPLGIKDDWKPDASAEKKIYPTVIVTDDTALVGDTAKSSYVVAFSSADFIYSSFAQSSSVCGNLELAINACSFTAGFDDEARLIFIDKTVTVETFVDKISENGASVIRIIFVITLPLLLVAAGFVIWFRRKNR